MYGALYIEVGGEEAFVYIVGEGCGVGIVLR